MRNLVLISALFALFLSGCAQKTYDYSAFLNSQPKSILVLPPTSSSNDLKASAGVGANAILPLCENGYYVFPTIRENRYCMLWVKYNLLWL